MWFVKVILLGASRLGKTTACRRLSGEIKDINSSGVENQPSTGIVESGRSVIIRYPTRTTATVLPSEWTTATDLNAEACLFLQYFYTRNRNSSAGNCSREEAKKKFAIKRLLSPSSCTMTSSQTSSLQEHSMERLLKAMEEKKIESEQEPSAVDDKVVNVIESLKVASSSPEWKEDTDKGSDASEDEIVTSTQPDDDADSTSTQPDDDGDSSSLATESEFVDSTSSLLNVPESPRKRTILEALDNPVCYDDNEVSSMFRKAMDSKHWTGIQHYLQDITFLKMEDTGGQPEFMDMLPALTIGPGVYLLFCKLTEDLDSHYSVTYLDESGECTSPEESTHSVGEILLTTLASISCFKSHTTTPEVNTNELFNKSVAYIIGTHKDQVTEEEIDKFDEKLRECVCKSEFFRSNLVQFSSKNRMVFPIDNMYGGENEVLRIRSFVEEGMKEHFKKLSIPAAWLVLSMCLRKRKERTASLQNVQALAEKLGILRNETVLALWFLHHYAGAVMFFPEVVELNDIVICDSQIVYDSITNLIVNTFKFGRVNEVASQRFKETGQFSLKDIENATSRITGEHLPLPKLLKLLQHLNIISAIALYDSQQAHVATSTQNLDALYFMPCVLQSLQHEQIEEWWEDNLHEEFAAAPLFIQYNCGFVPLGIFPALITNLARQRAFRVALTGIRKNRVMFKFGNDRDTVTLISQPKHFAVHLERQENFSVPTHEVCIALREAIKNTLKTVTSRTNYSLSAEFRLGFECPTHPGRKHLCLVETVTCPHKMICQNPNQERIAMKKEHLVWFRNVSDHDKISVV